MSSSDRRKKSREIARVRQLAQELREALRGAADLDRLREELTESIGRVSSAQARVKMLETSNHELRGLVKNAEQLERGARDECASKIAFLKSGHDHELHEAHREIAQALAEDKDVKKLRRRLLDKSRENDQLQHRLNAVQQKLTEHVV